MSNHEVLVGRSNITRLVWMVTLLGISAGCIMLSIVHWTLSDISSEREKLDSLQVQMTRLMASLDPNFVQARDELMGLLDGKPSGNIEWGSISKLKEVLDSYRERATGIDPGMSPALGHLSAQLDALKEVRKRCMDWADRNVQLDLDIPSVRKRVESSLRGMRASIESIEGLQRLKRAVTIRRYRLSENQAEADRLAREIIEEMGQGTEISSVKAELADLALLCERLGAEDQIDDLVNLRDNEFISTLHRLRRSIVSSDKQQTSAENQPMLLLEKFETDLFGKGYFIDALHQTVILGEGGLYSLSRERLILRNERWQLLGVVNRFLDGFHAVRQRLGDQIEILAKQTPVKAEEALAQAWKTMVFVALVSALIFLALSGHITRKVILHIRAFESTNRDLDIRTKALSQAIQDLKGEIVERQRVEDALRESEEALLRAKDGLEMRVEERTSDLKSANKRLEREISERMRMEEELRKRGEELTAALETTHKARETAEAERDRSEKMLIEVSESKRRLEILLSDATAREKRMIALKREVNDLMALLGRDPKYHAPIQVDAFLARQKHIIPQDGP